MSTAADTANAFLAAIARVPREKYPATHAANAFFGKLDTAIQRTLPPHLHPLFVKLRAFCVRQAFVLEQRLHINPTFTLLLSTRIVPPSIAFVVAAASTIYAVRYLYTHALDLLTNIIGVAYPAYQSIMAIEYGDTDAVPTHGLGNGEVRVGSGPNPLSSAAMALGISTPNLDKKQWLMYWAIYGVLTTADHWAGPILRLFPMYRLAKIGVLVWAQHQKYNGAAWLYDTFVRPLLPPPESIQKCQQDREHTHRSDRHSVQRAIGISDKDRSDFVEDRVKIQADSVDDGRPDAAFTSLEPPPASIWGSSAPNSSGRGSVVDMFARSTKDIVFASALRS
ncbi:hypothetical protein LPJ59_000319 [Coemansia sp. RSA 2399]|nr:hypothetical protein LPJ59_000319 [Coemansia sp. RSA 2399]KAJ1907841.1 hypothetical protein LPJ81_000490 [Coemansia sp. IMI 209127]